VLFPLGGGGGGDAVVVTTTCCESECPKEMNSL
jgi:hypothetical protein